MHNSSRVYLCLFFKLFVKFYAPLSDGTEYQVELLSFIYLEAISPSVKTSTNTCSFQLLAISILCLLESIHTLVQKVYFILDRIMKVARTKSLCFVTCIFNAINRFIINNNHCNDKLHFLKVKNSYDTFLSYR